MCGPDKYRANLRDIIQPPLFMRQVCIQHESLRLNESHKCSFTFTACKELILSSEILFGVSTEKIIDSPVP